MGEWVNINIFFIIIIIGLAMIFFLFKPLNIKQQEVGEMALLELTNFQLKELDENGLLTITEGSKGKRYTNDRYTVDNLDYTDNTDEYLSNIRSKHGLYKGDTIKLNGDVVYSREDGFSFQSQKANYDKKTKIAESTAKYISHMGDNKATGSYIQYDSIKGIVKSKNVVINYKIKER